MRRKKFRPYTKAERRAWWRSLTAEEQANYICGKLEEQGKIPNWDEEYTKVIKRGYFMR